MPESAFELGQESGRRFRESVEDQLSAIAQKLGVNVASLGDGGVGEYGRGVGPFSRGGGVNRRGVGQRGGRRASRACSKGEGCRRPTLRNGN